MGGIRSGVTGERVTSPPPTGRGGGDPCLSSQSPEGRGPGCPVWESSTAVSVLGTLGIKGLSFLGGWDWTGKGRPIAVLWALRRRVRRPLFQKGLGEDLDPRLFRVGNKTKINISCTRLLLNKSCYTPLPLQAKDFRRKCSDYPLSHVSKVLATKGVTGESRVNTGVPVDVKESRTRPGSVGTS